MPSDSARRVAVVGVSGVGKEYIRSLRLLDRQDDMLLVDLNNKVFSREVQLEEVGGGAQELVMHNTFPGHDFSVVLPFHTPKYAVEGIPPKVIAQTFKFLGVTHVIHATPPMSRGPLLDELWGDFFQLVEKPFWAATQPGTMISVGYLYAKEDYANREIRISAPFQPGWRSGMGIVPLLWDLGGHALSMVREEYLESIHVHSEEEWLRLSSPHIDIFLRYTEPNRVPETVVDGRHMDWVGAFDLQLAQFLDDKNTSPVCSVETATIIENHLNRLEGEYVEQHTHGGPATE